MHHRIYQMKDRSAGKVRYESEDRKHPQPRIFGIIMSYAMAYGMEVYNIAIKEGVNLTVGGLSNMTNSVFLEALKEAAYMEQLIWDYLLFCFQIYGGTELEVQSLQNIAIQNKITLTSVSYFVKLERLQLCAQL